MVVSFNLCALPREQKYQIQLDYEASFWAYQIKRNKKTREQVYNTIHSHPVAEQTPEGVAHGAVDRARAGSTQS